MAHLTPIRRLVLTALCAALCLVLPMAFHTIPNAGSILLPMHIPVLLCGILCGGGWGGVCGLIGPLISSLLTAMPPAAMLPGMMVECAVYGLISGLMLRFLRTGSQTADLYLSLLAAMAAGRTAAGLAKSLIFAPGTAPFAWVTTSLVTGIPGICLQLVLIPMVIYALTRARLLPPRYSKGE